MGKVVSSHWVEVESGVSLEVLTHLHLNSDPQDPKERLGCRPQTGFSDIKSHAFFRSIDWDLVSLKGHPCPSVKWANLIGGMGPCALENLVCGVWSFSVVLWLVFQSCQEPDPAVNSY